MCIHSPYYADVRRWFTGAIDVEEEFSVADIPAGDYELFLQLPDKYSSIASSRPEYSIRLANENTWEETTCYNKLNHTLTIDKKEPYLMGQMSHQHHQVCSVAKCLINIRSRRLPHSIEQTNL